MKKLSVKLKTKEVQALDKFLDDFLVLDKDLSPLEKCSFALLKQWQLSKLKPKTYFNNNEDHKFKFEPPVAYAFVSFFDQFPMQPQDYLGNRVLQISQAIHQTFS